MNKMQNKTIVYKSKQIMGGSPVFAGTRVPIETFLDYIQGGDSIDVFLKDFPSVKRKQVLEFLETIRKYYTSISPLKRKK